MVRTYDSGQTTTRRQAQEQITQGKSDSFLTPPRMQQVQIDLAASQLFLENLTGDDSIVELISLDEEVVQLVAAPVGVGNKEPAHAEVVQENARQDVVQGATLQEVVHEAALQEVVQEAAVQEVVQGAAVMEVVQEATVKEVVQEAGVKEVVQEAAVKEVVQEAAVQEVVQEAAFARVITTRSQIIPDFSFLDRVNATLEQTEDGQGAEASRLPLPISSTPAPPRRMLGSDEADRYFVQQLEETISPLVETCKICQNKSRSTDDLQDHILAVHCIQPAALIQHMEQQKILLSNLLAAQEAHRRQLTCIVGDIALIKQNHPTSPPVNIPSTPARQSVIRPRAPPTPAPPGPPASLTTYAGTVRTAPAAQAPAPPAVSTSVNKIAMITDSIGGNIHHDLLEKLTRAKITKAKAYGTVQKTREEGFRFPYKNFTAVVPQVLASRQHDIAVLQAPSVVLTNLPPSTAQEHASEQAREASYQLMKVAVDALKENESLKKIVICEAPPRWDQWNETNQYANEELHEALRNVTDEAIKNKIVIGRHSLDCSGGLRVSRYGDPAKVRNFDNIHLRGSSGKIAMTRSIALILAGAGLADQSEAEELGRSKTPPSSLADIQLAPPSLAGFRTQRGHPASRQDSRQFQLPVQNRFSALGN